MKQKNKFQKIYDVCAYTFLIVVIAMLAYKCNELKHQVHYLKSKNNMQTRAFNAYKDNVDLTRGIIRNEGFRG